MHSKTDNKKTGYEFEAEWEGQKGRFEGKGLEKSCNYNLKNKNKNNKNPIYCYHVCMYCMCVHDIRAHTHALKVSGQLCQDDSLLCLLMGFRD